ncbi:hypothetical protein ACOCHS_06250 [Propionibacteriaceae bacterium Y2011]
MPDTPSWINDPTGTLGAEMNAAELRRAQSALLAHDTNTLSARAGVLHGLNVTVAGLTATVGIGSAVVTPVAGAHGSYVVATAASEAVTLDARDATYARIDLIVLRIQDPEISGTTAGAVVDKVTGSPAAVPAAPTVPSGALELARVTVPAGTASPSVVDRRRWTAPLGGSIPCLSTSRPSGAGLRPGQLIFETDTASTWQWTGSSWEWVAGNREWVKHATGSLFLPSSGGLNWYNDPHLTATVPSGKYLFDALIVSECAVNDTDISTGFFGVTTINAISMHGSHLTATSDTGPMVNFSTIDQAGTYGVNWGSGNWFTSVRLSGVVTVPGGLMGFRHRRYTNTGNQVVRRPGSWLRLTRVD